MKKTCYILSILLLLSLLNGCASTIFLLNGRNKMLQEKETPLWRVYSRSHLDLGFIYFPFWAFSPANDQKGDHAYAQGYALTLGPFMIAGGLCDLPISLVVDTITLPCDLQYNKPMRDKASQGR